MMIQHVRINYDILDALSAIGGLAYILFCICTLLSRILQVPFGNQLHANLLQKIFFEDNTYKADGKSPYE